MLLKVHSASVLGIQAEIVDVEVNFTQTMRFRYHVVGLARQGGQGERRESAGRHLQLRLRLSPPGDHHRQSGSRGLQEGRQLLRPAHRIGDFGPERKAGKAGSPEVADSRRIVAGWTGAFHSRSSAGGPGSRQAEVQAPPAPGRQCPGGGGGPGNRRLPRVQPAPGSGPSQRQPAPGPPQDRSGSNRIGIGSPNARFLSRQGATGSEAGHGSGLRRGAQPAPDGPSRRRQDHAGTAHSLHSSLHELLRVPGDDGGPQRLRVAGKRPLHPGEAPLSVSPPQHQRRRPGRRGIAAAARRNLPGPQWSPLPG